MDSAEDFLRHIVKQFYEGLGRSVSDNFDYRRFSDADKAPFLKEYRPRFAGYFFSHYAGFYESYRLLGDARSQDLFITLILYKLLGWEHIRIQDFTFSDIQRRMEECDRYEAGPSKFGMDFENIPMVHYRDFPFEDKTFSLDMVRHGPMHLFLLRQYDYDRDGVRIMAEAGDHVIDLGAFQGESAIKFALQCGENGKVYGFDPLPLHLEIARHNVEQNNLQQIIELFPYGIGEKSNDLSPISEAAGNARALQPNFKMDAESTTFPIRTIDQMVRERKMEKLDLIKMDIEGAELAALKGARETLRRFRPKLAISLYHKFSDFIDIPQYLRREHPFYQFHLAHYRITAGETILYAIDKERLQV